MSISVGAMVPPALVLAVVGWSCWTIVGATPAPAKPRPAEEAARLSTDLGAPSARDPFATPGEPEPPKPVAKSEAKVAAPKGPPPPSPMELLMGALKSGSSAARKVDERLAAARVALEGLGLSATSTDGERHFAILGGRAYAEGDAIEGVADSLGRVYLNEIRPGEVLLRSADGMVAVRFSDKADASARGSSARPTQAGPAAKARRPASTGGVVTIRGKGGR